jgi:hypothetical protein
MIIIKEKDGYYGYLYSGRSKNHKKTHTFGNVKHMFKSQWMSKANVHFQLNFPKQLQGKRFRIKIEFVDIKEKPPVDYTGGNLYVGKRVPKLPAHHILKTLQEGILNEKRY